MGGTPVAASDIGRGATDSERLLRLGDRLVAVRVNPVRHRRETAFAVSVLRDVTDERRQEDELRIEKERFRITLASIGEAVMTADAAGAVSFMNEAAQALTGWGEKEADGRPLGDVFVVRAGPSGLLLVRRDGSTVAIDDSVAPIRAGVSLGGSVLVFR